MATTTFNTRISLKYDTYANWVANDPKLLKGEVAVVVVPAETGAVAKEPSVLFKVGDGSSKFSQLQFSAGIAADVYEWAKAAQKPTYAANEITGLSDYISGEIQDTDTQYKIEVDTDNERKFHLYSQAKGASTWTLVSTIEVPAETVYTLVEGTANGTVKFNGVDVPVHGLGSAAYADATAFEAKGAKDADIAAAKKAGDDAQAAVDTLTGKVGTVPADKTVVQMISDAQSAATYDDTQVKADIKTNADAITKLNANSETEGSVDYKIAQAVAAIMENPDETMNSINELVTWINDHATDALELSNKVTANEQDIAALEGLVGTTAVATQITDAIAAALKIDGVDKYALATDLTAAIARIAALETEIAKKANDADLAAIAKSGNVNDLIQTDDDYIIFNCGSSSEVI